MREFGARAQRWIVREEYVVIVCSCNVLSDAQNETAIVNAPRQPKMSRIYAALGCRAKCGRCTLTVKRICDNARIRGVDHISPLGTTAH